MEAFEQEQILAQQAGYVCRYDDYGEDDYDEEQPIAALFARRESSGREGTIRIDQPQRNNSPSSPHVLKMPQPEPSVATVRLNRDDDGESFGSGID